MNKRVGLIMKYLKLKYYVRSLCDTTCNDVTVNTSMNWSIYLNWFD